MSSNNWKLEILSNKGSNLARWNKLLQKVDSKDVYFTPNYMELFENTSSEIYHNFGGQALLAFYGNEDEFVLYPFFKRRILELDFCKSAVSYCEDIYDIISPWFFSGILISDSCTEVVSRDIVKCFLERFHEYCIKENIVSEFMRLNPFIKNYELLRDKLEGVTFSGDVVLIDLKQSKEKILATFKKSNRNCISKSRNYGVNVFQSTSKDNIDSLYELYTSTMKRVGASNKYFFPKTFFYNIFELMENNATLFIAEYNEIPIAASIFLNNSGIVHYYLSGLDVDYKKLCPTNFILYEAIMWAKDGGNELFELGGGYKTGDSLYNFKSSFSKTTTEFYVYKKVHNNELYDYLCSLRSEYENVDLSVLMNLEYFPAYRCSNR